MSCNRTICSIWHECDKALGEELKPLCAEENSNSLQQLKAEILPLVERGIVEADTKCIGTANYLFREIQAKLSAV
jgi:hypothetical protein